jgi:hypothetical protein
MTDFLQRLAERTLGLTPVAQPIIAPMFAPGPTIPDSTPAALEVDEFVESQPSTRSRGRGTIRPASPSPVTNKTQQPIVPPVNQHAAATNTTISLSPAQDAPSPEIASRLIARQDHTTGQNAGAVRPENSLVTEPGIVRTPLQEMPSAKAMNHVIESHPRETTGADPHVPVTAMHHLVPAGQSEAAGTTYAARQDETALTNRQPESASGPWIVREQRLIVPVEQQGQSRPEQAGQNEGGLSPGQQAISFIAVENGGEIALQQSSSIRNDSPTQGLLVPTTRQATQLADTLAYETTVVAEPRQLAQITRQTREQRAAGTVETPPAVPTIRVTIGRVDVRAVTAPATTRSKPGRPAPALSLDEYTRQNKERR